MACDGQSNSQIGTHLLLPDDRRLRHHPHLDRIKVDAKRQERNVDHVAEQCHWIRLIQYCYDIHQPLFEDMEKTIFLFVFQEGQTSLETVQDFTTDRRHRLIASRGTWRQHGTTLYTECHHGRLSVLFLTQNLYVQGGR